MKKKLKGSALLWAVCALLIVVFVLTGLLALNKTYAEEEVNNIAARRAEYLARSGVELTADMIMNNKLVGDGKNIDTLVVSSQDPKNKEGIDSKLEVKFNTEDGEIKVIIERVGVDMLSIKSYAEAGYMNRTITGVMERKSNIWGLTGYVTN
ncbi:MAG: hypothetical protein IJL67_05050 [Oscillospiraceae bacterium]|nr:hypothetical protein [Oscillospiraceae bacterium]